MCVTHVNISLPEAAPDAGEDVDQWQDVEWSKDGSPLVSPSVQVDSYQQLCEEDGQLEEGRKNEGLEVIKTFWVLSGGRERGRGGRE